MSGMHSSPTDRECVLACALVDILTIALVISVGNAVAWLIALYTTRGVQLLLWDVAFGMAGTALCALAFAWLAPAYQVIGLVSVGPLCAKLMIFGGDAIRATISKAAGAADR
jgi:hypothetical protein